MRDSFTRHVYNGTLLQKRNGFSAPQFACILSNSGGTNRLLTVVQSAEIREFISAMARDGILRDSKIFKSADDVSREFITEPCSIYLSRWTYGGKRTEDMKWEDGRLRETIRAEGQVCEIVQ